MPPKLYLIDGNSYVYRSFYAIRDLKNSSGFPTNALYGFASMLLKLLIEEKPGYMAVAFDLPSPTFRHKLYPEYKAHRPSMPEELRLQFPVIKEMVSDFNIRMFELEGYEADDILATLAKKFENSAAVYVLSQDKDCLQLVSPGIRVMRENKTRQICDEEAVRRVYGVEPGQFADCLALCGDSSDNIAGLPGVGWKTAAKLIKRFGSLDKLIADSDSIESEKLRGNVKTASERLLFNRKLVSLDCWVPVQAEIDMLKTGDIPGGKLREMFLKLEFKKLLDKIDDLL